MGARPAFTSVSRPAWHLAPAATALHSRWQKASRLLGLRIASYPDSWSAPQWHVGGIWLGSENGELVEMVERRPDLKRAALAAVIVTFVVGGPQAALAQTSDGAADPAAAQSHEITQTTRAAGDAYWTPERLKSAEPRTPPVLSGAAAEDALRQLKQQPPDESSMPARSPGSGAPVVAEPRARFGPADLRKMPYAMIGKLYYTLNGKNFACSASLIQGNILLTSAQCIRDPATGAWAKNVVFYLRYESQRAAKKIVPCRLWTPQGWVTGNKSYNWPYDYAILRTWQKSDGHLGYWFNNVPFRRLVVAGYSDQHNGGQVMQRSFCNVTRGAVQGTAGCTPLPFGGGAAGSPWVGEPGVNDYVVSLVSYTVQGAPNTRYGPRLNQNIMKLLNAAMNQSCK